MRGQVTDCYYKHFSIVSSVAGTTEMKSLNLSLTQLVLKPVTRQHLPKCNQINVLFNYFFILILAIICMVCHSVRSIVYLNGV